ncbi:hypothetical protein [Amycolatopsis sp. cmx-4-68]
MAADAEAVRLACRQVVDLPAGPLTTTIRAHRLSPSTGAPKSPVGFE